jgi:hypothetical protein
LHDLIGIISAATTDPPWHTKTRKMILLTYKSNDEHPDIDRKSTNLFFHGCGDGGDCEAQMG